MRDGDDPTATVAAPTGLPILRALAALALSAACTAPSPPVVLGDNAPADASIVDAAISSDAAPPRALPALDDAMTAFMAARNIPGGALAVARNGRLLYAKGYGATSLNASSPAVPVTPESLFRIASLTKQFTSCAVMQLVEANMVHLDDPVFPMLGIPAYLPAGATADPRIATITVRHLLEHSGGWDRGVSPDPMFESRSIASALGVPSPPGPTDIIRYMEGRPLDFTPGARYVYSNFGYCVLGRLIEHVTGMSYADYVQAHVLAPAGITRMRLGRSLVSDGAQDEVAYSMSPSEGSPTTKSVFDSAPGVVRWPYGGFDLEAMDSHGAWVASVVDLMRFAVALDDTAKSPLLQPATFASLYGLPPAPLWRKADGTPMASWYAFGWLVRPVAGGSNYWHDGSLPGTATYIVRRADGIDWATAFDQRSEDTSLPDGDIDGIVNTATNSVIAWPSQDLFPTYP